MYICLETLNANVGVIIRMDLSMWRLLCFTLLLFQGNHGIWGQQEMSKDRTLLLPTVTIGTQKWTTKNLDVDRFRNGDLIAEAKTHDQWIAANREGKPVWCHFENNPSNGLTYGKLYNWYAVIDPRGLAPWGYRIPTDQDWITLGQELGGEAVAGIHLKATEGWSNAGNGSNKAGFCALPGGDRNSAGWFLFLGYYGAWWSSSEPQPGHPVRYYLDYAPTALYRYVGNADGGCSIRLLKE